MNKVGLRKILKQITLQILILIFITIAGLAGITYILAPSRITGLFH